MEQSISEVREFGLTFARLIANLAVDPHGYFEKQYAARIENARSVEEISGVVAHLVRWVESPVLNEKERERLNHELDQRGMPSIEDIRQMNYG